MLKRSIEDINTSDDELAGCTMESSTYILNSRRNTEKVVWEFYKTILDLYVLELSADDSSLLSVSDNDRYSFTISKWAQIRADFLVLISPLKCKLPELYIQALNFLCQVFGFMKEK